MHNTSTAQVTQQPRRAFLATYGAWLFVLLTVILTVAIIMLPLPAMAAPLIVVFIPTLIAAILLALTEGGRQVREQLFSSRAWRISLKWAAISLVAALALRVVISLMGLVLGYSFQPAAFSPFLVMTLLFAAGEEIGWRGYALPRVLRSFSPLAAALLLGLPWALLHLPLNLPGKLNAGAPMLATFILMLSLAVLTTWIYLASGRSLTAPVLLHGGQTMFVFLNDRIPTEEVSWIMAGVYALAAVVVIAATRGRLGASEPLVK